MDGDVLFIDTVYNPEPGDFCKLNKYCPKGRYLLGQWHHCRDIFHVHLSNSDLFFFCHEKGKCNSIIEFMKKFESKLNLKEPSNFGPTQRKGILWIKPSKWWMRSSMRRSFLTILLRASFKYSISKDNFYESIFAEKYFSKTRYATEKFLLGYTKYTGKKRGWYKQFFQLHPSQKLIDVLLVKPTSD
ncbi:MAG: hypothetical protein EKK64_02935 [Neisseriaceae bacterium]|nr:MAG: hypothetical protein EKK64_02935 [Neisseriaceae bacterium]